MVCACHDGRVAFLGNSGLVGCQHGGTWWRVKGLRTCSLEYIPSHLSLSRRFSRMREYRWRTACLRTSPPCASKMDSSILSHMAMSESTASRLSAHLVSRLQEASCLDRASDMPAAAKLPSHIPGDLRKVISLSDRGVQDMHTASVGDCLSSPRYRCHIVGTRCAWSFQNGTVGRARRRAENLMASAARWASECVEGFSIAVDQRK